MTQFRKEVILEPILLTQTDGFILGPIANVMGKILNGIYWVLDKLFFHGEGSILGQIGIISIVIVLFTILTKFALLYFTIKQQKSAKINSVIAPEIKAIQKKYEKRKDQQSQMAMSQELSDLYAKYGTSPTGGCLQLLIQFPIFLALYRVVTNVPAYIGAVKDQYMIVINSLKNSNLLSKYFGELTDTDKIIDVMSGHDSTTIADFNFSGMINELNNTAATEAYEKISEMNKLFVFDLSISPASAFATLGFIVFLIPVLACVSQYVTSFLSSANNNNSDMADNSTMNTLKMMMYVMPIFSAIICWQFATGIGIYWITGSLVAIVQQLIINAYFKNKSIDDIIKESQEKARKKRERRGITENQISNAAYTNTRTINRPTQAQKEQDEEQLNKARDYYNNSSKMGSIASRANMVKDFNERNKK